MLHYIFDLFLALLIVMGPVPLCFLLISLLRRGKEKYGSSHYLLVLLTVWCILETLIGLFLGIFHGLTLELIILAEIIIFAIGIAALYVTKSRTNSLPLKSLIRFSVQDLNPFEIMMFGLLVFTGLMLAYILLSSPTKDFDSLSYHFPVMFDWYQSGSLDVQQQFILISRYPFNWELLCSLFLFPFQSDFAVELPNIIAWTMFGLALYLITRSIGISRIYSLASAALLLHMPLLLKYIHSMHVDLTLAVFFLVGMYFILVFYRTGSYFYLALILAVLGMLAGIKTSGLIYGTLLVFILIYLILKYRIKNKNGSILTDKPSFPYVTIMILGGISFLFLGGYWYLRNLIEINNPLGNVALHLGKLINLPGKISSSEIYDTTLARGFEIKNAVHWKIFIGQLDDKLSIPFFVMAASALLLPIFYAAGIKVLKPSTLIGMITLSIITFCLYWLNPFSATNFNRGHELTSWMGQALRFAFPFTAVLALTAAAGLQTIRIRHAALTGVILVSSIPGVFQLRYLGNTGELPFYTAAAMLIFFGSIHIRSIVRNKPAKFIYIIMTILTIILFTFFAQNRRNTNRSIFYEGIMEFIEKNTSPGETIGYVYCHRAYFLYGKNLDRKVLFIPSEGKSFLQWIQLLEEKGIRMVASGPIWREWSSNPEFDWLTNKDHFSVVWGEAPTKGITIYRLND